MDFGRTIPAEWIEHSAVVVYLLRIVGGEPTAIHVSANIRQLTGFTADDALAPGWWTSRLHPDDLDRLLARQSELATGSELIDEYRFQHRDGGWRWIRDQRRRVAGADSDVVGTWIDITELKRREEELREGERRYRSLFEANPQPMWVYDRETLAFLAVNDAAIANYGWSRDEMLGMTLRDIRPPEDLPRLFASVAASTSGLESAGEWRHRRRDGSVFDVEITSHSLDFDGRPARMVVAHDLTERRRAERTLRETESSYSSLFHSVSDAIFIQDEDGRFLDVNEGAVAMYGYPRERFLGDTPEFLSAPGRNDLVALGEAISRVLGGEPQRFEFWGRRSDGDVFPKEVRLFPGSFRGRQAIIALAYDISERKRAEAELRLLREAIEQVAEAIVITDREAGIQYVNAAFQTITGYKRDEVLGRNTRILKSGEQKAGFYHELWSTISAGRTWQGRIVNRRKDGSLYDEELTISPVFDDEGQIAHFVAVKRDVHERLELEQQLLQAQKLESIGRLAGGVAHDFNNMLSIVLGYGELAKTKLPPEHPAQAHLDQIVSAADRSSSLVRQLLAFARRQPIAPQLIDLNEQLAATGRLLRKLVSEEIELTIDPAAGLWPVRIDPGQIDQILANLVVNARDAITGAGRITVTTRNIPATGTVPASADSIDCVLLTVTDTGAGMDLPTRERIFEPFFTTKRPGEGTGLGLATVYGVVQQNGGCIEVESAPGCGASFRIYLPRATGVGEDAVEDSAVPPASDESTETVLLVEDNTQLLKLTREQLRRLGYRVLAADTVERALELADLEPGSIDLLLTDVVMPGTNGRDLAERLLTARPGMRVLYMSGYTADIIAERGVVPEGVQFLQKPFARHALACKVREALDS